MHLRAEKVILAIVVAILIVEFLQLAIVLNEPEAQMRLIFNVDHL